MAWNSKKQCVWIVTLMMMTGPCSVALKCEDNCTGCSTTSIVCHGGDNPGLPEIVSVLLPCTQNFTYVSTQPSIVNLGGSNFEHLTKLQTLNITDNDGYSHIPSPFSSQSVFAPLANLQVLKINVEWYFEEANPLDYLFQPLMHLEELDLSQTKHINITNLRQALYGLSNSTQLKTINLSNIQGLTYNIQGKEFEQYSTLNLTWFLEPLQNCPIRYLNLANNFFHAFYPGIIRYTPQLVHLDVSHNKLDDASLSGRDVYLLFAFFFETLLHKRLLEVDFSYQGGDASCVCVGKQTSGLLDANPTSHDLERFTKRRRNFNTGTFQQGISSLTPDDVVLENWSQCTQYLMDEPCEIFSPNCSDTLDYLRHNHSHFCEWLYTMFYRITNIKEKVYPCSALPTVDDMFQKNIDCDSCFVIPTIGATKSLKLNNLVNYQRMHKKNVRPHIYPNEHKVLFSSVKPTGIH